MYVINHLFHIYEQLLSLGSQIMSAPNPTWWHRGQRPKQPASEPAESKARASLRRVADCLERDQVPPARDAMLTARAIRRYLTRSAASSTAATPPGQAAADSHVHVFQPAPDTPFEARLMLEQAARLLKAGEPLPPSFRKWLVGAIEARLAQPRSSLDRLLQLRSRSGGAIHAASRLPARDLALHKLMAKMAADGNPAEALARRVQAHRRTCDPELERFEARFGRIPGARQLRRILAGQTVASQLGLSIDS